MPVTSPDIPGLSAKDIIFPGQIDLVIGGDAAAGD
jgi:hypothetical protein